MSYNFHSKRYYNHIFLIPPEQYLDTLKKFYLKFGNNMRPKTLKEFKKLALIEAKKVSQALVKISRESRLEILLSKEVVLKVLETTFESVNGLFIKINHNFKNERRKVYNNNAEYMEVIKKFEVNKLKLFRYSIKKICKNSSISFESLQRSVFLYLDRHDNEVIDVVNSAAKLGKHFAIAPNSITLVEVEEILDKYHKNLNFILTNSKGTDVAKYSLIIVNDIVYENFGLEEEQIFNLLESRKEYKTNVKINSLLTKIKDVVSDNLSVLFEL